MLRLLADDLTGALDSSAEFTGLFGAITVVWPDSPVPDLKGSLSIDSGTRERDVPHAFARAMRLAPMLQGATIAFKKIDSLLRGPWIAELDACLRTGYWDACIVAPAFPYQGRGTRRGQQYAASPDGGWQAVGADIITRLRQHAIDARPGRIDAELSPGVTAFDAESDDDLVRVVEIGRRHNGRVLWCGSGGLASALAAGAEVATSRKILAPVLGIFGSDHAATAAQLARCTRANVPPSGTRIDLEAVRRQLAAGLAFARLHAPEGSSREETARHFEEDIARLVRVIEPPRTLIISGGETLKALCLAAGAHALKVTGRLEPGVPRSVIEDGAWKGVEVISKSGAFGPPDLWWKLLDENAVNLDCA